MRWGNDSIYDPLRLRCTVQEKTPRMLLLPNPRNGRLRRASPPPPLLLLAAVLLCSVPGGTGLPARRQCPHPLDCIREGRQSCKAGSTHCGPCISVLVENEEGRCVARKRQRQHGKASLVANPEEEIDFLQSIVEKQKVTEIKPAESPDVQRSRTDASKHKQKSPSDKANTTALLPSTTTPQPGATVAAGGRAVPLAVHKPKNDKIMIIVISVCVVVGSVAVIMASVCYVKLQKESRLAQKVDYPAYGGTGTPAATVNGTSVGDKTLAQSAQMYHYQHRKQQMLSVGNRKSEQNVLGSEATSDEEEVGGDFTVYECPGLAPTGEMEVKNPLFDDSTLHYQGNHK